jgi:hypothetical protein
MDTDHIDWGFQLGEIADAIDLPYYNEWGTDKGDLMRAFEDYSTVQGPNAYAYVDENGWLVAVDSNGTVWTWDDDATDLADKFATVIEILGTW